MSQFQSTSNAFRGPEKLLVEVPHNDSYHFVFDHRDIIFDKCEGCREQNLLKLLCPKCTKCRYCDQSCFDKDWEHKKKCVTQFSIEDF